MDYESNLFDLYHELINRQYKIRRSICFINFKPVQREIFAADFRDRIIHHLLFNYLHPIFEPGFIKDSYSCRIGKGTHFGIKRMQHFMRSCTQNYRKEAYVLKIDILGYFMRMDRKILMTILENKLLHYKRPVDFELDLVLYLLEKVIFNDSTTNCFIKGKAADWKGLPKSKSLFHAGKDQGLPIGNLTSQFFGNVYLNGFDHFVKEQLGIQYYGRYVDDMVLLHPDKNYLKECLPVIQAFLFEHLALELHPRKVYLQPFSHGIPFLGTYIKPYRTYIGKRTKTNFYKTVEGWNDLIKANNNKLSPEELELFVASMNSYLGILKHYQTYRLRKKMIRKLNGYFFNYVYVSGGYAKLVKKKRKLKNP